MRKFLLLIIAVVTCSLLHAQDSYNFRCDYFKGIDKVYSDIPGKILVDIDGSTGKYCLMVEVPNPTHKGWMAFGYITDPEAAPPTLAYHETFQYDDSMKKMYSIISDGFEIMICTKYENGSPKYIMMSEKTAKNDAVYIKIPYSEQTYNGIYGVIARSKNKIKYRNVK